MPSEALKQATVDVVVLNYRAETLTRDCLDSLATQQGIAFRVWLIDNASPDGSGARLQHWMQENAGSVFPLGGCFIQSPANLGFAGGNNLALRQILQDSAGISVAGRSVWLLNNDTLLEPDSLRLLVEGAQARSLDLAGSCLRLHPGGEIQAYGGHIHPRTAASSFVTRLEELDRVNYIVGASLWLSLAALRACGPIPEDYFLYSEEADLCLKATRQGFRLGCVPESVVHHRQGASTGGGAAKGEVPFFSDCLMVRNRTLLGRRYLRGPGVWAALLVSLFNRMVRGQSNRVLPILRLVFEPRYLQGFVARHAKGALNLPAGFTPRVQRFSGSCEL